MLSLQWYQKREENKITEEIMQRCRWLLEYLERHMKNVFNIIMGIFLFQRQENGYTEANRQSTLKESVLQVSDKNVGVNEQSL